MADKKIKVESIEKVDTSDSIKGILESIEKSFKGKFYVGLGDSPELEVKSLSTGIPVFDNILGGGLKRGGLHLVAGAFSTGKTFLCQKIIESAQKKGDICALIDVERRFDPKWFQLTGTIIKDLIVLRPNTGEQAFEVLYKLLEEKIGVAVIDSFAALLPVEQAKAEEITPKIGLQARLISEGLRKVCTLNSDSVVVATNQLRTDIGTRFHRGILEKMAGGSAQYYYASSIIQVRRKGFILEKIKGKEEVASEDGGYDPKAKKIGFIIECLLTKCNFAPPFSTCQIPFNFMTGQLDNLSSIIDVAIDMDIIKQGGAWFTYSEQRFQGKQGLYDYFNGDEQKIEHLKKETFG